MSTSTAVADGTRRPSHPRPPLDRHRYLRSCSFQYQLTAPHFVNASARPGTGREPHADDRSPAGS
ncbi:hypothetical protein SGPA1_40024 [Streptomyces misionensis JCM 4497]